MTFEIDEEKLNSAIKNKKENDNKIFGEFFFIFLETLWEIFLGVIGYIIALAVIIFVGGAILGIMLFGWRQL